MDQCIRKMGARSDYFMGRFRKQTEQTNVYKKPKQLRCKMLTLVTNPNIEGLGNLHKVLGYREE